VVAYKKELDSFLNKLTITRGREVTISQDDNLS